jgi:tetratricopeptide (TPR) repeat protein
MRRLATAVLLVALGAPLAALAEQQAPRDIWPRATGAAMAGDLDAAQKKTTELLATGKAYGINSFPIYALSAAALSRQAEKAGKADLAAWAAKASEQLDPSSPGIAFANADLAREQGNWSAAAQSALTGYARSLRRYRPSVLGRSDLLMVLALAISLTAALFAIALFIRYARVMAHDFRELLGQRFHGGAVSVLAFALLFLPIFLWLGPMWLVFYWLIIFFGYAGRGERIATVVLAISLAGVPLILERAASWAAGMESPVMIAAVAGNERSYQPDALRRIQELITIVPDDAIVHLLLGNLYLQEGDDQQAAVHYRRAVDLDNDAGAHVNLGNLHFFDNDFAAASSEYEQAEKLDPKMAIAFYNNSVASGELYKFDDQGQKLEQAKQLDRDTIERLAQSPPAQKVATFKPSYKQAWTVASAISRKGVARTQFGNYAWFDPVAGVVNPLTIGALLTLLLAVVIWKKRRRSGFAGACIKCGRTFCHRCKSARESATYCTQCIHIYLKRDGVSLDTKRAKLEEVHDHQTGLTRRNRFVATFLPGSAQVLEGRTTSGVIGMFIFLLFVTLATTVGHLAPAIGPVAETAQLLLRVVAIALALVTWLMLSLPVYRRRQTA